jgi:hypothetical protein
MQTFKDTEGREWKLRLTIGTAQRVQETCGVNLLEPEVGNPPLLTRLGTDEMLLANVICAMLGRQFEEKDLDAADVREAFDGDTILAAQTAFYAELQDFFHQRGRRERAKAVAKQAALIEKAVQAAEAKIDQINVDNVVDQAMTDGTVGTVGEMSGSSPEPSASTPAR